MRYFVRQMPRSDSLGQFEQLVLTSVVTLSDNAYGVTIHKKVGELASSRAVTLGAIYVALDRLEDKGFVSSWLSDPTAARGGRAKRCYRLEVPGERALKEGGADPSGRIVFTFRLVTGRKPSVRELTVLRKLYDEQLAVFRAQKEKVEPLGKESEPPIDKQQDSAELAASAALASAILNFDEAILKR